MGYFDSPANLLYLKELVDSGVAVIPVNDAKEPYAPFKGKKILGLMEILDACRYYSEQGVGDCCRVAIRTGKVSQGLVCIDVDSKHKEGFGERIYMDFRDLFPEIFDKLRIEKTPSGGLHFYYLVSEVEGGAGIGTANLAYRYASEEELLTNPALKRGICFLELKASDGSLCTAFPSKGYSEVKKADGLFYFGSLSIEEHLRLIEFCYLYNDVVKEEVVKYKKNGGTGLYIEGKTPFDQFNLSDAGSEVLIELGWTKYKSSRGFDQYIKPGKKDKGIGATFNQAKRTYAILTTNSGIETKCYNPSSLLCQEKFGGSWENLYSHLVSKGFGKLKDFIEKEQIKRAIRDGVDLPANISSEAKEAYEKGLEEENKKWKFGIFWIGDSEEGYEINRELLLRVSEKMGFRRHKEEIVLISGYLIKDINERGYYQTLKEYIGDEDINLLDCYEEFLQKSGKFTTTRLEQLDLSVVLISDKKVSYKFFQNCYIKIYKEGFEDLRYEEIGDKKIWEKDIKNRNFEWIEDFNKGLYWEFINNAIGWSEYLMKCIGFYAHDFRDEESYLVYALEKCENPKEGGGSGKNIFWKLFGLTTSFKSTAGSMIKKDNQFLQSWNGERVFVMADLPKGFDLIFFKDMVTEGAVIRKLYKDEFNVDVSEMAKLGASGNYSFDDSDPGIKRRLRIVEFTDFYTTRGGVKTFHDGKMFPKDWSDEEYLLYDNIIASCIQEYLIGDSIIDRVEVSDTGWAKKMEQLHNHLYTFVKDYISSWVEMGRVPTKVISSNYSDFKAISDIKTGKTAYTINKAIEDYCHHFKIPFVYTYKRKNGEIADGVVWDVGGIKVKGKYFGEFAKKFMEKNGIFEEEIVEELPF